MAESEESGVHVMSRLEREHVSTLDGVELRLSMQTCALLGRAYELLMSGSVSESDRRLAESCILLSAEMRAALLGFEGR
jgi:hypothetical protein